jgi:hypothetical protein
MSFCDGSFCTCCRRASCASATSGSSPTGAVRSCSRCALRPWPQLPNHNLSPAHQKRDVFRDHSGPAHSAEARWRLSRDSPPPKRDYALLQLPGKHNDLLFDISHSFSAETPAPKLRGLSAKSAPRDVSAPATPPQTYFSLYPNSACKTSLQTFKTHNVESPNGSLQGALVHVCRSVSDTALGLYCQWVTEEEYRGISPRCPTYDSHTGICKPDRSSLVSPNRSDHSLPRASYQ